MKDLLCLLLVPCATGVWAQQATVATGGEATGPGGSASYSVGQTAYTVLPGPTASMAQGVQQPYEISLVTGLDDQEADYGIHLFPNPATDAIVVNLGPDAPAGLLHRLCDASGAVLAEGQLSRDHHVIRLDGFAQGTYILSIMERTDPVRSYRIVKH